MKMICFGSGSSGNCYYLESDGQAILIDLGIGLRAFRKHLSNYGIAIPTLRAIFVTHDHTDHIKAIGPFAQQFNLPVYATQRTHEGILRNRMMNKKIPPALRRVLEHEQPVEVGNFRVTPFVVPHDAWGGNTGYFIEQISAPAEPDLFSEIEQAEWAAPASAVETSSSLSSASAPVAASPVAASSVPSSVPSSISSPSSSLPPALVSASAAQQPEASTAAVELTNFCLITDCGEFDAHLSAYVARARNLVIEANYDLEMLEKGPYPYRLKRRIQCGTGHLANHLAAEALRTSLTPLTQRIWLCHLSEENNHPDKAVEAVSAALRSLPFGAKIRLEALRRLQVSGPYNL